MSEDVLASLELSSLQCSSTGCSSSRCCSQTPEGSDQSVLWHQGSTEGPSEVLPSRVHNLGSSDPQKGQGKGNVKAQSALEV